MSIRGCLLYVCIDYNCHINVMVAQISTVFSTTCLGQQQRKHQSSALLALHYGDVIMGTIASQIISLAIFYSSAYSATDQRKHQSSASLAFVRGIHRWPVNSPHKGPVTRIYFHLMTSWYCQANHRVSCSSWLYRSQSGKARLINDLPISKCVMKLRIHSQTSTVQPLKFGKG